MSHLVSWFAGIDLGDRRHHGPTRPAWILVRPLSPTGGEASPNFFPGSWTRAGRIPVRSGWRSRFPTARWWTLDRGFATFAVNPKQADRARELLTLSGAKDDPRDAEGLALALRVVPRIFRHLQPKHPVLVLLRDRARLRADLVKQRTRLSQKIRAQLLR